MTIWRNCHQPVSNFQKQAPGIGQAWRYQEATKIVKAAAGKHPHGLIFSGQNWPIP